MSSNVCQLIVEPPRASKLKLAPPKPKFSRPFQLSPTHNFPLSDLKKPGNQPLNEQNDACGSKDVDEAGLESHKNGEFGRWDFIQTPTNTSYAYKEAFDNENAYAHPLIKRPTSMVLDQNSLEMCTESLGSETGSYTSKSDDEVPLLSLKSGKKFTDEEPAEMAAIKKMNRNRRFPPPLSSISSSGYVQVRPHRVGGRLVIRADTVRTCHTYFLAERGDGRLRLRVLKGCSQNFPHGDDEQVLEKVEDYEGGEGDYFEDSDTGNGDCGPMFWCEDIDGKSGNVRVEIGIENLQMTIRDESSFELPYPLLCNLGVLCHN